MRAPSGGNAILSAAASDPAKLLSHLRAEGVLAGTIAPDVLRFVTHHDIDDEGLERALGALKTAP